MAGIQSLQQKIYGLPAGSNLTLGCPACKGVLRSQVMERISSVEEYIKACEDCRHLIEGLRDGSIDPKRKAELWAISPCGIQHDGVHRTLANTLPRLVPKKGVDVSSGADVNPDLFSNVFVMDFDHLTPDLTEQLKDEVLKLAEDGKVDVLLGCKSAIDGAHVVATTDGELFKDCTTLADCQQAVLSQLSPVFAPYLDTKVSQFTSLLFLSQPEDIWIISKRLFF